MVSAEGGEVCSASDEHAIVRAQRCHFAYEDQTPYVPFGTTVFALIHQELALVDETMDTLQKAPFNKVRFCIFPKSYEYNQNEPQNYAFHRDEEGNCDVNHPDHTFWNHLEAGIIQLEEMRIQSDLILLHLYDRWAFA